MEKKNKRTYKDTLFVDLFCQDRDGKKNFLDLYNALHGTNLQIENTELRDVRIDGVLYTTLRNDVSMLVDGRIVVLCEQQSTINENMPLRCLMYISRIYEGLMDSKARFRKNLQKIPSPEFYVFYNGKENLPERQELHLKDAFISERNDGAAENFPLDLRVIVYNINKQTGKAQWEKCKPLTEYNEFVTIIQNEYAESHEGFMERAVRKALKAGVLSGYLERKSKVVENMFFGEYDYATDIAVQREEAEAKGEERGKRQKAFESARNLLIMNLGTHEQIAQAQGISIEEVEKLAEELQTKPKAASRAN